jgi:uncharacterized protein (DUF983 family)
MNEEERKRRQDAADMAGFFYIVGVALCAAFMLLGWSDADPGWIRVFLIFMGAIIILDYVQIGGGQ